MTILHLLDVLIMDHKKLFRGIVGKPVGVKVEPSLGLKEKKG